ncbi:MAG: Arylsulfatase, partial [Verrucomicrobiota bacterium]
TGWANASNTPFRKFKSTLLEGGISTPLIIHWPAGLKAKPGSLDPTPGYLTDIMPTAIQVSGASYPENFKGQEITPLEGVSLAPCIAGPSETPSPRTFYWEQYGYKSVRHGDLKAVFNPKNQYDKTGSGEWELYDLSNDRTELKNLAAARPEEMNELVAKWDAWADRCQVNSTPGHGKKRAKRGPGN